MSATIQTARKAYQCQRCRANILPGQDYWKRRESGQYGESWFVTWHVLDTDCKATTATNPVKDFVDRFAGADRAKAQAAAMMPRGVR